MRHFNPHPPRAYKELFSPEQWRDIEAARARFDAYRNKVQPYPALLEDAQPTTEVVQPEWTLRQWDTVQQLKSEVVGWRKKHAEALLAIDRLTAKIKLYEGGDLT